MERRSSNRLLRPSRLVSHAGTPGRIRTCDLRIRSPLLYPLSYRRLTFLLLAGPLVPSPLFARCRQHQSLGRMVGARGFEPPTPCSQSRCATRLRHAPKQGQNISLKRERQPLPEFFLPIIGSGLKRAATLLRSNTMF